MKTPTVTVLVGSPASGKSTYAKKAIQLNANLVRLNRDDFRMSFFGKYILDKDGEKMLTKIIKQIAISYLKQGRDLILDNTHCNLSVLKSVETDYIRYADIEYIVFNTSWSQKKEWNAVREAPVPDDVMFRMHKSFVALRENFNFEMRKKQIPTVPISYLPKAIVFDLDNTLSTAHRRGPYEYHKAENDLAILPTTEVMQLLKWYKPDHYKILFVTGRDETGREAVLKWLDGCFSEAKDKPKNEDIFMRKQGDMRSSGVVKEEIYLKELHTKYDVVGWFDDDENVVEMLKFHGVRVYNTNQE